MIQKKLELDKAKVSKEDRDLLLTKEQVEEIKSLINIDFPKSMFGFSVEIERD